MAEKPKEPSQSSTDEDFLEEARKRFHLASEAESEPRRLHLEDLKFRAGEQWPEALIREREADGRPCHVVNRMPQFVRQITNDQRQNRPAIKVHPVDDKADIETAKIYRGLIRHIEYNSNAEAAYDTAFDGAVTGGFGYFRIITDYVSPMSFDQEILIKRIKNPLTVYCDPTYSEPDGSDMEYCFIVEDLTKEEYEAKYPDSEMASLEDFSSIGDSAPDWMPGGKIRVAEYYYKKYEEVEIALLSDGHVVKASDLPKEMPEGYVVAKRKARIPSVKWCKMNAVEKLEEADVLGEFIPVIPVLGEELDIDGKRVLEGVIRHAKDSQRMLNYWKSSQTETIALAPRAPWVGYEGQFQGHEAAWRTAHKKNHAFLQVKPVTLGGQPAPLPQRQVFEPPIQAIAMASAETSEDLKATTGIYDAALGARSNETSGVAIARRNQQAQTSNFHFVDNLTRSIRHAGRILVSWIPNVYDTARTARIIGEDDQPEIIKLNQFFQQGGQQKIYALGYGKYDVVVETGPSYATKRQEAADSMLEMSKASPQVMGVAADLIVKNMDWPGAEEIANRLKKTLPPGIAEDKDQPPIPPQVQAQMQQMSQMVEALTQQLNEANQKIETKMVELESKERIEMRKLEVQLEIERAKLDQAASVELLNAEIAQLNQQQQQIREFYALSGGSTELMPQEPTGGPAPGSSMEQTLT